jgi:hypothetical protein
MPPLLRQPFPDLLHQELFPLAGKLVLVLVGQVVLDHFPDFKQVFGCNAHGCKDRALTGNKQENRYR